MITQKQIVENMRDFSRTNPNQLRIKAILLLQVLTTEELIKIASNPATPPSIKKHAIKILEERLSA